MYPSFRSQFTVQPLQQKLSNMEQLPKAPLAYIFSLWILFIFVALRLLHTLPSLNPCKGAIPLHKAVSSKYIQKRSKPPKNISVMALLGSGGHTGEMIRLLNELDLKSYKLTWLVSEGDSTSLLRTRGMEKRRQIKEAHFMVLARARKVGEPLVLSVFSTLRSLISTATQLFVEPIPDILLINGPGTCVPVAYFLYFLRFIGWGRTRIIYVESLARVNGLSLSGKLVMPICDRFIVQWRPLAERYRRAEYYGILI